MRFDLTESKAKFAILTAASVTVPNGGGTIAGLSLPVQANTVYEFEFNLIWQSSATNRGLALGVSGPAGQNFVLVHTQIPTSLTAVTYGEQRAYTTGTATAAIDSVNVNVFAKCYGSVSVGATPGTLILWANKNTTGGTVSIMQNSFMRLSRVSPNN